MLRLSAVTLTTTLRLAREAPVLLPILFSCTRLCQRHCSFRGKRSRNAICPADRPGWGSEAVECKACCISPLAGASLSLETEARDRPLPS